jgi:hypothetical protein
MAADLFVVSVFGSVDDGAARTWAMMAVLMLADPRRTRACPSNAWTNMGWAVVPAGLIDKRIYCTPNQGPRLVFAEDMRRNSDMRHTTYDVHRHHLSAPLPARSPCSPEHLQHRNQLSRIH